MVPAGGCAVHSHSGIYDKYRRSNCYMMCGCFQTPFVSLLYHIHHPIPNFQYQTSFSHWFAAQALWFLTILVLNRAYITFINFPTDHIEHRQSKHLKHVTSHRSILSNLGLSTILINIYSIDDKVLFTFHRHLHWHYKGVRIETKFMNFIISAKVIGAVNVITSHKYIKNRLNKKDMSLEWITHYDVIQHATNIDSFNLFNDKTGTNFDPALSVSYLWL